MKYLRILLVMMTFLASFGCQKSDLHSKLVDEGSIRQKQADADLQDLAGLGVDLNSQGAAPDQVQWDTLSHSNSKALSDRLEAFVDNVQRLIDIVQHKGMSMSDQSLAEYQRSEALARKILAERS